MLKKVVIYGIGIYILGLIFSGVTYAIMDFVPDFIAGMIITTPIYGLVSFLLYAICLSNLLR